MGFIRSGLVVSVSTILFLSLFLGNLFLTLSWSLEYDAIQPNLEKLTNNTLEEWKIVESLQNDYTFMETMCISYDTYNFINEHLEFKIPCEIIRKGPIETIFYGTDETIKQIYFQEYNCSFWECIKTTGQPTVIFSQKAEQYWHSLFYLTLLISIILFILLLLFTERKRSTLTITGILIILASIPFRKINWLISLIPEGEIASLFGLFFTRAYNVFLVTIIIGAIVLLIGLAFEFFGAGMKLGNLFKKASEEIKENNLENKKTFTKEEVKKIVKEEINKQENKKEIKQIVQKGLNPKQNKNNNQQNINQKKPKKKN